VRLVVNDVPTANQVSTLVTPSSVYVFYSTNMGASAEGPGNYGIDHGVHISSVVFDTTPGYVTNGPQSVVRLDVARPSRSGRKYTLGITNVSDADGRPLYPSPTVRGFYLGGDSHGVMVADFDSGGADGDHQALCGGQWRGLSGRPGVEVDQRPRRSGRGGGV